MSYYYFINIRRAPSAPSSNGGRQITMEELDARIKAEMEHEKEMIQRSLNNR